MSGLLTLNAMDEATLKWESEAERIPIRRDKGGYLLVVQIMCIMIDDEHRKKGGAPPLIGPHEDLASPKDPLGPHPLVDEQQPQSTKRTSGGRTPFRTS